MKTGGVFQITMSCAMFGTRSGDVGCCMAVSAATQIFRANAQGLPIARCMAKT